MVCLKHHNLSLIHGINNLLRKTAGIPSTIVHDVQKNATVTRRHDYDGNDLIGLASISVHFSLAPLSHSCMLVTVLGIEWAILDFVGALAKSLMRMWPKLSTYASKVSERTGWITFDTQSRYARNNVVQRQACPSDSSTSADSPGACCRRNHRQRRGLLHYFHINRPQDCRSRFKVGRSVFLVTSVLVLLTLYISFILDLMSHIFDWKFQVLLVLGVASIVTVAFRDCRLRASFQIAALSFSRGWLGLRVATPLRCDRASALDVSRSLAATTSRNCVSPSRVASDRCKGGRRSTRGHGRCIPRQCPLHNESDDAQINARSDSNIHERGRGIKHSISALRGDCKQRKSSSRESRRPVQTISGTNCGLSPPSSRTPAPTPPSAQAPSSMLQNKRTFATSPSRVGNDINDQETITTGAASSVNDVMDPLCAQLRIGWWNVQCASTVWFEEAFWDLLAAFDIVFLSETRHTDVPLRAGWKVFGLQRNSMAGGVLALVRDDCTIEVREPEYPYDDFVWLGIELNASTLWWVGGAYIPGPSDMRFRCLQGDGRTDQFIALSNQLRSRSNHVWFFGGDLNCITGSAQPLWGAEDLLDALTEEVRMPERKSTDHRAINGHGRRLLEILANKGLILNGIIGSSFADGFTRMPQKADDSPGVIDYAITSPNSLDRVKSFQIITVPPDLSDHNLLAINIELPHCDAQPAPSAQHFSSERLRCIKLPHSPEQWNEINEELSNSAEWGTLIDDLERHIHSPVPNRDQAQTFVDDIVSRFVNLLYAVFGRHHLTKKRCFDNARRLPKGAVNVAPPHLRRLRTQAAQAHRQYLAAVKCNASISVIARAKRVWNAMSSRCRKAARATRRGFCDNWECMWGRMRRQEPRQLWKTFRSFTVAESETIQCSPDAQWQHWAGQGDVQESVWSDEQSRSAEQWVASLRDATPEDTTMTPFSPEEIKASRDRVKKGRAAGADGIPSDALHHLPCLVIFAQLLFNIIARSAVYPTSWGIGLIRSLLKPGKPADATSSLRGIRLLCSMASWLGQILDQRARGAWQACNEQFGFRQGLGCLEAVVVLLAMIRSRVLRGQRLYVLFIDLRTAFPSLNRPILICRMFECGLSLAFCRLVLAMFDVTVGVACIGKLVGDGFKEMLGIREGSVEGPHHFSMYIDKLKNRLETKHPRLCTILGVAVALLLYADDAAIPADSLEDLQLAAQILEEYCNDYRLFISVPKTVVTVFHAVDDTGVRYTSDGRVEVDGVDVEVRIYGQRIKAAPLFKYLGVVLDEFGSHGGHFVARCGAFQRAIGSLKTGLSRIPSYPHSLLIFLWRSLVAPVAVYGCEVYAWAERDTTPFVRQQTYAWRSFLRAGGRASVEALQASLALECVTSLWRVSRVTLFLRLVNSPAGSLQQLALITLRQLDDHWYSEVVADLRSIMPHITFSVHYGPNGLFMKCSGRWNDTGEYLSAQLYDTLRDLTGESLRHGPSQRRVRWHIQRTAGLFKSFLRSNKQSELFSSISRKVEAGANSKLLLLHARLQSAGPPLAHALDWIGHPTHRAAVVALFCGDFFLGRYAGNYFAKPFLPSGRHAIDAESLDIDASRICIHCWHSRHQLILEGEGHAFFECPISDAARSDFIREISASLRNDVNVQLCSDAKLLAVLRSSTRADWSAFGRFASRTRQLRRAMRRRFLARVDTLQRRGFANAKKEWKSSGGVVCRHGVFFQSAQGKECPCMRRAEDQDWQRARFMPTIDIDLHALTVVPFESAGFRRLGQLQADMRRLNW